MEGKKLSQEDFDKIYSKVTRLAVEVIIQNDKGVLLTKRAISPSKGKWHFPGGGVIYGETLEQALKRIANEELNLDVSMVKVLGTIEYPEKEEIFGHPISLVISAKVNSGDLKPNFQATEIDFFKKVPENTMLAHKRFVENNLF